MRLDLSLRRTSGVRVVEQNVASGEKRTVYEDAHHVVAGERGLEAVVEFVIPRLPEELADGNPHAPVGKLSNGDGIS